MSNARLRAGFTLIELMVVVMIIAALATMVLPRVIPASDEAKRNISKGDIANITVALKLYRLHNDTYPPSSGGQGLSALVPRYLERVPKDPWKQEYQYRYPARESAAPFDLWSKGPDGSSDTEDDVTNWEE